MGTSIEQHRGTGSISPRGGSFRPPGDLGVLDWVIRSAGEEWSARDEDRTPYALDLLSRATKRVVLVTGKFEPEFYEQPDLLRRVEDKLALGVEFHILFDKSGATSLDEAQRMVVADNPGVVALKQRFPNLVRLYWAGEKPRLHFAVVDSTHTMHEQPDHIAGTNPATLTRYGDKVWARSWERRFDRLVETMDTEILTDLAA